MKGPSLLAFIFARGGSKGVKDKNIRIVGGKPLLGRAIECAQACDRIGRVVVSTNSKKIAAVAEKFDAEVLWRSDELSADGTPEFLAWRHAIESYRAELDSLGQKTFISLPTTSPLRSVEDVNAAIAKFELANCDIIFGISPSHRNPMLNMVTIGEDGLLKIAIEGGRASRRQDVPDFYDITTTIYVADINYVMNCTRLIDGRVGYVKIPVERSLDIDSEYDLYVADFLCSRPYKSLKEG